MNEKPPTADSAEMASVTDLRSRQQIRADNVEGKKKDLIASGYEPDGRLTAASCKVILNSFHGDLLEKAMSDSNKMRVWQEFRKEVLASVHLAVGVDPHAKKEQICEETMPELALRFETLCAEALHNDDSTVVSLNAFRNKRNR